MDTSSRVKFNLVGNTFTHSDNGNLGYSVHGKISKHIEWVFDGSGEGTVFMDNVLGQVNEVSWDGPKYGWLLESKYVTPGIVEAVRTNPWEWLDAYDLIFTHNQELLHLSPRFKWVPAQGYWIKHAGLYPKFKRASMITSNKAMFEGHQKRLDWVERLRDKVDLYGRGFNPIANKEEGLCPYMYSVAIENGQYETYFTEKLLDCFASGTIPIYLGAPDIGKYFNPDGIITLDEYTAEDIDHWDSALYWSKIEAIRDNLERVRQYEILEDFIWDHHLKDRHGTN